jgi:acetylornithine deacetylase/succinyl-diaminopimelate desuccinylase-like protein
MAKTAEFLKSKLIEMGADNVEICPTAGHPILYGEKIVDPALPTVLVYGHYDVQPPDPLDLWTSGPFDPVIKKTERHPDGAIFARGACDDKGQMYMHFKAFEYMAKNNALHCNVKFMIEGEEEVGSPNLGPFIIENKEKIQGKHVLLVDDVETTGATLISAGHCLLESGCASLSAYTLASSFEL